MKIVKQGKIPQEQPVRDTCSRCKTEVEFIPSQDARACYDQRDGDSWLWQCPTCDTENWLDMRAAEQQNPSPYEDFRGGGYR